MLRTRWDFDASNPADRKLDKHENQAQRYFVAILEIEAIKLFKPRLPKGVTTISLGGTAPLTKI